MNVDEAGRKREPVARDALVRIAIGEVPDRDDPSVRDGDIGGERFAALSVIDAGALQDRPEQRLT
jgi:hypothetical protein